MSEQGKDPLSVEKFHKAYDDIGQAHKLLTALNEFIDGVGNALPDVQREQVLAAAQKADWGQVVMNQGPPCFHLLTNGEPRFCLAAERWAGHHAQKTVGHRYVSLADLLGAILPGKREG